MQRLLRWFRTWVDPKLAGSFFGEAKGINKGWLCADESPCSIGWIQESIKSVLSNEGVMP